VVYGIEKFKEYFRDFTDQYVFIGGTACDILLDAIGASFRATKDLDIVLIIEEMNDSFGSKFWEFIEDGGYKNRQRNIGKEQFYRFAEPKDTAFPFMIELFCRKSKNIKLQINSHLTPVHISDNIASLSAILLNDAYYDLLLKGKRTIDGFSVLKLEYIILFKIRAWLDLMKKVQDGIKIDSKSIKKHKNDIFRLLINVTPSSRNEIDSEIHEDINLFLKLIRNDQIDLANLKIVSATFEELLVRIRQMY
jgi:hypothetical protein